MKHVERFLFLTFVALILVFILQQVYYYFQLPQQVAIHFNFHGEPDNWADKTANIGIAIFLVFMMGGGMLFSYWLIGRGGDDLINLPRKEFWLAPERRENTISKIRSYILVMGIETWIFLLLVMQKSLQANLSQGEVHLPPTFAELIIYLVLIFATIIHMVVHFTRRAGQN